MEKRTLEPGTRLFLEGDVADVAYLINEGKVEIIKQKGDEAVVVNLVGKGEMVGEMALFDNAPRSASARCTEETTVMVIPREEFAKRMESSDPVLQRVVGMLIRRLRDQTQINADRTTIVR